MTADLMAILYNSWIIIAASGKSEATTLAFLPGQRVTSGPAEYAVGQRLSAINPGERRLTSTIHNKRVLISSNSFKGFCFSREDIPS